MKKRHILICAAAAMVLAGCASYEHTTPAVSKSVYSPLKEAEHCLIPKGIKYLTLVEAQNIALTNNPSFRQQYFAVARARARYYQSFSSYMPTVAFTASMGHSINNMWSARVSPSSYSSVNPKYNHNNFTFGAGFGGQLLLFDSLQREMNLLAARAEYRKSEADEDDARRLLLSSVAYAYNNVLLAAANIRIAQADMDYNTHMLKDTQLKFDAGAVPLSDVLNFKINYNNGEGSLISAQYDYQTNKYVLAGLLGLTEGTIPDNVKFPSALEDDGIIINDINLYLDLALANRPDLKAQRHALEASKYAYWSSLGAFGPTFTATYGLQLGYDKTWRSGEYDYDTSNSEGSFEYGIGMRWDLFTGGSRFFAARQAHALMNLSDYAVSEKWIEVVTDVRTAYDNYVTSVKHVKLYKKTYELTKQTRDLVEEEYRAGSAELTRINEAQRELVAAESNLVASIVRMEKAKAQLDASVNVR